MNNQGFVCLLFLPGPKQTDGETVDPKWKSWGVGVLPNCCLKKAKGGGSGRLQGVSGVPFCKLFAGRDCLFSCTTVSWSRQYKQGMHAVSENEMMSFP